ncbi:MAG: F0F1 ATP synthase subunit A [Scardovia wiggsiae]|uniref:F0F1 ATP synthase subunit A n=1 Tax=Scardovia wiggsiae TaxID=230143 RepID=UPI00360791FB
MAGSLGIGILGTYTAAQSSVTLAAAQPEIPGLEDFLPEVNLFPGTIFAMNRIIMVRLIMTALIVIVLGITAARAKLIPGRWQSAVEGVLEFVQNNITYQVMGELRGKQYTPFVASLFLTIACFNLCGVIPGANIAATATIAMPLMFSIATLVNYFWTAHKEQGILKFLRNEMFPPGVPWPVYIILAPIQLLELLVFRPLSLTLRLFANMVSGHLVVAICFALTQFYLVTSTGPIKLVGAAWFLGGFALTAFEIFVALLQAFVFAILTTVYINSSFPETE